MCLFRAEKEMVRTMNLIGKILCFLLGILVGISIAVKKNEEQENRELKFQEEARKEYEY